MKKRKDGRYAAQVYLGMVDGKRKYKTIYGKTQKEVKAGVAELKIKLGKGIDIAAADGHFKGWGTRLLDNKSHENLSHSYLVALKSRFLHLAPLYQMPLNKIAVADIQKVLNALALWRDGNPPLAKRTIGSIRELAGKVFEYAIVSRVIDFNPAKYATIPKSAVSKTREVITEEQQAWIRETPHRAQRAAMTMLYSGLRRGELIALTWADVSLSEKYINVNKSVDFMNGRPILKPPKTKAGIRQVNIPDVLVNFLSAEKRQDDCLYVVHSADGSILTSSAWKRLWESYMVGLNLKYGMILKCQKTFQLKSQ